MLGCSRGQVWFGRPALKQINVESLDVATTLMFLNRASGSPAEGTGRSHLKYPLSSGFRRRDGGGHEITEHLRCVRVDHHIVSRIRQSGR